MAKGISIGVASDTREFSTGIAKGVIKPLEDAGDKLDELARDGDRAGAKLEDAMDDARKATSDFKREQSELGKVLQDAGEKGRKAGSEMRAGTEKASEGVQDLKQEAKQSAAETAASFSGSADDVAGMFQEVAANAFSGFGPAGMVAGTAAAVGIGLVTSALGEQAEATDEMKAKFADLYRSAAEEGRTFLTAAEIQSAALEILFDPTARKDAARDAKLIGTDLSTMVRALAGDEDAVNTAIQQGLDKRREVNDAEGESVGTHVVIGEAVQNVVDKLTAQKGLQEENKAAAGEALEVTKQLESAEGRKNAAAAAASEERGRSLQAYADAAARIPNPVLTPILNPGPAEAALQTFLDKRRRDIEIGIVYRNGKPVLP